MLVEERQERAGGQGGRGQQWPRGACEEGPARWRRWSLGLASASRDGALAARHVLGVGSRGPGVVGTPTSTPSQSLGRLGADSASLASLLATPQ